MSEARLSGVWSNRGRGRGRGGGVRHGRKWIELDLHSLRRVLGLGAAARNDKGDRLPDVADPSGRQRMLKVSQEPGVRHEAHRDRPKLRRELVRPENHRDSRHGPRRSHVDGPDPCVGVRASHDRGVEHPRQMDIVHETRLTAQPARVSEPSQRPANRRGAVHGAAPRCPGSGPRASRGNADHADTTVADAADSASERTRSGVSGSTSSAGSAPSASRTAFTTAAGAPIVPDSPMPLIPALGKG